MPIIQDKEFGKITIRRSSRATQVRIRVAPDGTLRASMPLHAPTLLLKHLLRTSRNQLRTILAQAKPEYVYENGMQIGKSHKLIIHNSNNQEFSVARHGLQIIIKLPLDIQLNDPHVARQIRDTVIKSLRVEAKSYLPQRLSFWYKNTVLIMKGPDFRMLVDDGEVAVVMALLA